MMGSLLYVILYILATLPGWPVGFALFGRRHAAGWISGALIGYAATAFTLWFVIKVGFAGAIGFSAAWLVVTAAIWFALGRRNLPPLVVLPEWKRRDTLARAVQLDFGSLLSFSVFVFELKTVYGTVL